MSVNHSPLRILQISDTHIQSQPGSELWGVNVDAGLAKVLEHLQCHHWPADFILATGDLVQDEGTAAYQRLLEFLAPLGIPVYCLPGNHDDMAAFNAVLASGSIRRERHVIALGWQFILLDTTLANSVAGHLAASELEFLESKLLAHPALYAMVCLHHQPLPVDSPWLDGSSVDNGAELLTLLDSYPQVRAVIWGHIHQEFSARRGHIHLLGAPSTCVQFKPGCSTAMADSVNPGYRWFELHPDGTLLMGVERVPAVF